MKTAVAGKIWDLDSAEETLMGLGEGAGEQELRILRTLSALEPPLTPDGVVGIVEELR